MASGSFVAPQDTSTANSANADGNSLWVVCTTQMVKVEVSMLNGAVDAVMTCEQVRVADRAPGAAASRTPGAA